MSRPLSAALPALTAMPCPALPCPALHCTALPPCRPMHRYILKADKHPKFNRVFTMFEGWVAASTVFVSLCVLAVCS